MSGFSWASGGITQLPVTQVPQTQTGGFNTFSRLVTAATTNATSVKNVAANIGGGHVLNTSGTAMYFKLFNKASSPTVGTDVPMLTILVPANAQVSLDDFIPAMGVRLSLGLAYCLTAGPLHTDTVAVAAGSIVDIIYV